MVVFLVFLVEVLVVEVAAVEVVALEVFVMMEEEEKVLEMDVLVLVLEVMDGVRMTLGSSTAAAGSTFAPGSAPSGLPDSSPAPLSFLRCCRFSR